MAAIPDRRLPQKVVFFVFTFLPPETVEDFWKHDSILGFPVLDLCTFWYVISRSFFFSLFFLSSSPHLLSFPSFLLLFGVSLKDFSPSSPHSFISTSLFFLPFFLSYLFWWWSSRYRKKHATIWNHYSNVTRVTEVANKEHVVP